MAIYEYKCNNYGTISERFQGIKDEPVKSCPACMEAGIAYKKL